MRVFKTSSVVSLLLLLWTPSSTAIDVCGLIQDEEVWSITDSPVIVTCDLNIAGLTINPGVEVHVAGNHQIVVNGILRALGTRESPVVFKPAAGNAAGWGGIYFEDTIEGSQFLWTRIEGSTSSGLHLVRSNPILDYVTFRGNSASNGGGLFVELLDKNLDLNNCLFADNHADTAGGAIYAVGLTGRDDAALVVSGCVFLQNTAGMTNVKRNTRGGALNIEGNSRIVRSTFRRNEARAYTIYAADGIKTQGGAIFAGEGRTEITATMFFANACRMGAHSHTPDTSRAYGGAIHLSSGELLLSNSVVAESVLSVKRRHDLRGSGVYVAGGTCSIVNTTMAANSHHAVYSHEGDVDILSSILFFNNNGSDQISDSSNNVIVTYSDIQNGFDGEGNIGFDPIFDDYYRIVSPSPAIDAGHPGSEYYDMLPPGLGGPRNDMGATGGPQALFSATADAGPDQEVEERTTVTLNGTGSIDLGGGSLSYSWRQIAGPIATLSSSTAAQPTFPAEEVTETTTLTFQLVVNGGDADSAPATVNINVGHLPLPPIADAGLDQVVDECRFLTLDGTGSSDPDGDSLSYSWRQTAGPPATLSASSHAQLTVEAPLITEPTMLTFELVVNDGDLDSEPDTVDITVREVAACDDGDPCTTDSCTSGACTFTPVDCDDVDLCTTDTCDPADGLCKGTAVVCSDGLVCDPSTGECVPCITDSGCDDGNPCTDGTCNSSGECVFTPDDMNSCDDSDMCNGFEACRNGACDSGIALDCDDGVFCNGEENCANGACSSGEEPCDAASEVCDEVNDECKPDSDGDGVSDGIDQCPNTRVGTTVDDNGCLFDPLPPRCIGELEVSRDDGAGNAIGGGDTAQFSAIAPLPDGGSEDVTESSDWSSSCGGTVEAGEFTAPDVAQDSECTITATHTNDDETRCTGTIALDVRAVPCVLNPGLCGACGDGACVGMMMALFGWFGLRVVGPGRRTQARQCQQCRHHLQGPSVR